MLLCLRPSPALAAENLLLRKQLALYQERDVTPRHASNATRFTLAWLAHWFDRRPTTKCATGLSDDAVSTGGHSSPAHSRWDITRNLRRLGDLLSARGDAGRHRCPRARDVNRGGGRNAPLTPCIWWMPACRATGLTSGKPATPRVGNSSQYCARGHCPSSCRPWCWPRSRGRSVGPAMTRSGRRPL